MSPYKIAGCCTSCDQPCFEVLARWDEGTPLAGEPKGLGMPNGDALRVTFLLFDGTHTDLTFCAACAAALAPERYSEIWVKNLRSWQRQLNRKPPPEQRPDWFVKQFSNGLLCELGRFSWKELVENGR